MIIFVIPAYNEEKNIQTLLIKTAEKMQKEKLPYKIIIINDGSTDDTLNRIEMMKGTLPLEVYSHYPNKGVGEAFRVGFSRAIQISRDSDIIITKEADNTSDLGILAELISKTKNGYDVVLASCYAKEGTVIGTTFSRIVLSKVANMLLKFSSGRKDINTYSSFYRAYSVRALKEMYRIYGEKLIEEDGFECVVELLIKLCRNGRFKITEVPMVLDGGKRVGKSKMRTFKTIKGFLKVILKEGIIKRKRMSL